MDTPSKKQRPQRRKFARWWEMREPARVTHRWVWRDRSKYQPHQGKAEMARRVRKGV